MKKLLLASAVAALSVTAAQAAPTVYGKAFLTVDVKDGNSNSVYKDARTELNSNTSRIGVKGSEALTANTDVVYQLEYGIDVDANTNYNDKDEAKNQFYSRDTYLGLSNKQYGTLVAGRLSAIDGNVDFANVTAGSPVGGDNVLASFDAPRANNAVAYFSPSYNGVQAQAMYVLDEDNNTDTLGRDAFGVAVKYEPQAAYRAGVSYIQAGKNSPAVNKAVRVSGAYDVTPSLTVGALYQNTNLDTTTANKENEHAFTLSASQKVANTAWTTYGQLDLVDNVKGVKDAERKRIVVGGKYAFNKATTGHIYGAYLRSENFDLAKDSKGNVIAAGDKANAYGIGAGLEYKF